ncbi:MAG: VOC family protein [Deltaproteobacteria bacterium]|nr:MAG: VOC family protein [Deltaproteobacteria bacterium]
MAIAIAESLDHFVVPVDDIVVAEEFYVRVFGGVITKRNGLNTRQRKRGAVPHTFIQIGGKRMGVYLQSDERPQPTRARGLPTYSFTTTAQGLDAVTKDLSELGARFDGPVNNAYSFANQSLFMTDPTGNHYAIYTPKNSSAPSNGANGRMTGVGYIELEAPSINASVDFYEKVLGFEVQSRTEDNRQATLRMASGQTLILTEAPFSSKGLVMSRKVPGPHIAFYVPATKWSAALKRLDQLGIANGDRGAAKERHDGQGGTYMDDPAGYVIQFITDGME